MDAEQQVTILSRREILPECDGSSACRCVRPSRARAKKPLMRRAASCGSSECSSATTSPRAIGTQQPTGVHELLHVIRWLPALLVLDGVRRKSQSTGGPVARAIEAVRVFAGSRRAADGWRRCSRTPRIASRRGGWQEGATRLSCWCCRKLAHWKSRLTPPQPTA